MEEMRKRGSERSLNENDDDSSASLKKLRAAQQVEGEGEGDGGCVDLGEDIMAWLSMDDDDVSMNLLQTYSSNADLSSHTTTVTARVKFIDNPYETPVIFQSSSSYVTINVNEESCGSSFSDSESSFMVSVDTGGIEKHAPRGVWGSNVLDFYSLARVVADDDEEVCGGGFAFGVMDGCDGSELDDYLLPRFPVQEQEAPSVS